MKADLVCMSGGVKGVALVGSICCLEEAGYEWDYIAGTSAGAIVTSLLSVGYTGTELKPILEKLNYNAFNDKDKLQSIPLIGQFLGLLFKKGIYSGDYIENFLNDLYKVKGKTKFKDISVDGECKLKVLTCDITHNKLVILPDDLINYGIDPMEFEIAKAVRMSMSIPFYFKPVKLKTNSGTTYFVDGGLLSNFPIWLFDVKGIPNKPTFGLKLQNSFIKTKQGENVSLIDYVINVTETLLSMNEELYLCDKDLIRTMEIPTLGIYFTDFNLTEEQVSALYQSGYDTAKNFLKDWNFEEYKKNYRNN